MISNGPSTLPWDTPNLYCKNDDRYRVNSEVFNSIYYELLQHTIADFLNSSPLNPFNCWSPNYISLAFVQ